jgi:PPE-repeat protein
LAYLVGGLPAGEKSSTRAKTQPASNRAAAPSAGSAAAASAQATAQARRRRRTGMRGYGDEYMTMNIEVEPDWDDAAKRGAGTLGFAGTAPKSATAAAGLTTLAADSFEGGPARPMMPASWGPDPDHDPGQEASGDDS